MLLRPRRALPGICQRVVPKDWNAPLIDMRGLLRRNFVSCANLSPHFHQKVLAQSCTNFHRFNPCQRFLMLLLSAQIDREEKLHDSIQRWRQG